MMNQCRIFFLYQQDLCAFWIVELLLLKDMDILNSLIWIFCDWIQYDVFSAFYNLPKIQIFER